MSASALTVEIAPHMVQSVTVLTRNAPENRYAVAGPSEHML